MKDFDRLLASAVLCVAACGPAQPESDVQVPGPPAAAVRLLDAAERAIGAAARPRPLQLTADASVAGPRGEFRTLIHSSSDGRARMAQEPQGFLAGVGSGGGWVVDAETGERGELAAGTLSFVRGHELHMLALVPRSRLAGPVVRDRGSAGDTAADTMAVAMALPAGDSVVLFLRASDTLPVGLRMTGPDPDVWVSWSDWTERDGLRLFTRAAFRQGAETFDYRYDSIAVAPIADSTFEAPEPRPVRVGARGSFPVGAAGRGPVACPGRGPVRKLGMNRAGDPRRPSATRTQGEPPMPTNVLHAAVAAAAVLTLPSLARAQVTDGLDAYWAEVSRTVAEGDFEGYAALYHPDAVLVSLGSGTSYPIADALAGWEQGFVDTAEGRADASVDFRLTQRLHDETTAHETGIFRYTLTPDSGEAIVAVIHFEALLVKQDGEWLMVMEYQKEQATTEEWEAAG